MAEQHRGNMPQILYILPIQLTLMFQITCATTLYYIYYYSDFFLCDLPLKFSLFTKIVFFNVFYAVKTDKPMYFIGRVTLFFANNYLTEYRITMESLHYFF